MTLVRNSGNYARRQGIGYLTYLFLVGLAELNV